MKLYEFLDMAVEETYECYIYDNAKEKNIFTGLISEIPDELLLAEITSWEVYDGKIGLNIDNEVTL